MTLVVLSLAEMASMAPTSGGQYHWVSEFAPPEYQKLLSYFTGWMSAMSWQAGAASGPFLVGTMIQSLVYVNKESYEATNWQGTMMVDSIDIAAMFSQLLTANRSGRSRSSYTLATSTVEELCLCSRTSCSLFTYSDSLP
jgi:choline transport protein